MGYCYIALIDDYACWNGGQALKVQETMLRDMGMQDCLTSGPLRLFVSKDTPTLPIQGGGMIVGHLFSNDGMPIKQADTFPNFTSHTLLGDHLLQNYWGDYILIYPTTDNDQEFKIMRDPAGGVPCVYSIEGRSGFITSDISIATSIKLHSKQIDWDFVSHCLIYPHLKTQRTGLSDVSELLPGCSLTLRRTDVIVKAEWSPWDFVTMDNRHSDPHVAAAEIRTTVTSVIKAYAETDKSILLELSGGLDSSIVAACLLGTDACVTCSTLVTPVPGADEWQYAQQMADYLGVELHAEALGFENARFDVAPPLNAVAPRMGFLQYAVNDVMETAGTFHDVASFFSGGGGDSVFCYLKGAVPAADAFKEGGLSAGIAAIQHLSMLHQCTIWKAGRLTLRKLMRAPQAFYKADRLFLNPSIIASTPAPHPWSDAPIDALPGDRERIFDLAGTQVFRDGAPRGMKRWLRLPLLSQPVMEACLKVPTWMWILGGENRSVARAAFADLLPKEVLGRRSKGTFTNYSGAVYQRNKNRMRDFLLTGHLQEHHLLAPRALNDFFEANLPARDKSLMRIFDLCMIESWIQHQT